MSLMFNRSFSSFRNFTWSVFKTHKWCTYLRPYAVWYLLSDPSTIQATPPDPWQRPDPLSSDNSRCKTYSPELPSKTSSPNTWNWFCLYLCLSIFVFVFLQWRKSCLISCGWDVIRQRPPNLVCIWGQKESHTSPTIRSPRPFWHNLHHTNISYVLFICFMIHISYPTIRSSWPFWQNLYHEL